MNLHGTPKFCSSCPGIGSPFAAQVLGQHKVGEPENPRILAIFACFAMVFGRR